jgi:LysM repeat protein
MWATFRTSEDCILTFFGRGALRTKTARRANLFKEPPSPSGHPLLTQLLQHFPKQKVKQALLSLTIVSHYYYQRFLLRSHRTYKRIAASKLHSAAVLTIAGILLLSITIALHSPGVTFADGEEERMAFILGTYMYPDSLRLNVDTGLNTIALAGENIGGSNSDNTSSRPTLVVTEGETLSEIAARYNLSSTDFLAVNPNLDSKDAIYPGQVLVIPDNAATPQEVAQIQAQQSKKVKDKKIVSSTTVIYPINYQYISQYYGEVSSMDPRGHTGIDLVASVGTTVRAATSGCVIRSADGYNGGYGKVIILKSQNSNLSTLYGHLSQRLVKEGECVNQGETIGKSGSTGHSSGPHLHFETRVNGQAANPMKYLKNVH